MAQASKSYLAYADIFDEFVNDASFLWVLRENALTQAHYAVADLLALEQRIVNLLDGLHALPQLAWDLITTALAFEEGGEAFVAAAFAFTSSDENKINHAVTKGVSNPQTQRGLISALARLPAADLNDWLKKFYLSKMFAHKTLALAVSAERREDPGELLTRLFSREDCLADELLLTQALRAAAELKRLDLLPQINQALSHAAPEVKFHAIRASILLGDKTLAQHLQPFVFGEGHLVEPAMQLAFRALPSDTARSWIKSLTEKPETRRRAVAAVGILGFPEAVSWLIGVMSSPEHARIAGEAFTLITGFDLNQHGLSSPPPAAKPANNSESEDMDADIEVDSDENLPWPDASKIQVFWQRAAARFSSGRRYLMGQPIVPDNFRYFEINTRASRALTQESGGFLQRQRRAAALELALSSANAPFFNVDQWVKA